MKDTTCFETSCAHRPQKILVCKFENRIADGWMFVVECAVQVLPVFQSIRCNMKDGLLEIRCSTNLLCVPPFPRHSCYTCLTHHYAMPLRHETINIPRRGGYTVLPYPRVMTEHLEEVCLHILGWGKHPVSSGGNHRELGERREYAHGQGTI